MTIREAVAQRIPRVTKPQWRDAYVRLPLLEESQYGPWAELYDPPSQAAMKIRPGSQRLAMLALPGGMLDEDNTWVPFTGTPSEWEEHPDSFAWRYLER